MAESTIITGQFVRISQTPASIGERLLALVIDYFLIVIYVYSTATLLTELRLPSGFTLIFFLCVIYLPILGYSFLCETFNHGQSFGKRIMNIRVVKADGTTPSISSYLLRRFITRTGKCHYTNTAIRWERPSATYLATSPKGAGVAFHYSTRQQSGEIPSNSASGLSVLCIGRDIKTTLFTARSLCTKDP